MKSWFITVLIFLCLCGLVVSCGKSKEEAKLKEEFAEEFVPPVEEIPEEVEPQEEVQVEEAPIFKKRLEEKELKEAMAETGIEMRRLQSAVNNRDWEAVQTSSQKIEEDIGRRCVSMYIQKLKKVPDDFLILSERFHKYAHGLVLAGKSKDLSSAKFNLEFMEKNCTECHRKFRKS